MGLVNHLRNAWEYNIIANIIRLAILDYQTKDKKGYQSAEKFLFAHQGDRNELNEPINDLEWYLSFTDIHPDAIRRNIRRR